MTAHRFLNRCLVLLDLVGPPPLHVSGRGGGASAGVRELALCRLVSICQLKKCVGRYVLYFFLLAWGVKCAIADASFGWVCRRAVRHWLFLVGRDAFVGTGLRSLEVLVALRNLDCVLTGVCIVAIVELCGNSSAAWQARFEIKP